jgi:hypothetical protein
MDTFTQIGESGTMIPLGTIPAVTALQFDNLSLHDKSCGVGGGS